MLNKPNNNLINEMKNANNKVIIRECDNSFIYYVIKENSLYKFHVDSVNSIKAMDFYKCKIIKRKEDINGFFANINKNSQIYIPYDEFPADNPESLIKTGDELLIQIKKEAYDNKKPVGTLKYEWTNKLFAISYKKSKGGMGFSKKLSKNVKEYITDNLKLDIGKDFFVIFRTECEDICNNNDIDSLEEKLSVALINFKNIISSGNHSTLYTHYSYENYLEKLLSDGLIDSTYKVVCENSNIYQYAMTHYSSLNLEIQQYNNDSISLSALYGLKDKLDPYISKKVWLKSGGYLFVEKTEALNVIDVNSGKSCQGKNKNEAALNINIEAAKEIVKQIELRNISGIIIIDFINMNDDKSITILIDKLTEYIKGAKSSINIVSVTKLGLFECTRPKTSANIYEMISKIDKTILM